MSFPKAIVVQVAKNFWQRAVWTIDLNGVPVYKPVGSPVSSYVDEALRISAELKLNLASGTRVRTTKENPAVSRKWEHELRELNTKGRKGPKEWSPKRCRKWGVSGMVVERRSDGYGPYYTIWHGRSYALYDPSEFELASEPVAP